MFLVMALFLASCGGDSDRSSKPDLTGFLTNISDYPEEEQELIRQGREQFNDTNRVMPDYVGNRLSCASCHAGSGRSEGLTLLGVEQKYPQYMEREGREVTLEERTNGCFLRSMNGSEIDPEGEEMEAFMAYYGYLSDGVDDFENYDVLSEGKSADSVPAPDVEQGENDFDRYNCMSCHGGNTVNPETSGPDLWGPGSFNDGAGMSTLSTLQYYIKNYMPKGNEGTLSEQEASNIAGYILMQDRPEFEGENVFPYTETPNDYLNQETKDALINNLMEWEDMDVVESDDS